MNKYTVTFSIMTYTGQFNIKAKNRYDALKQANKKFKKQYKSDLSTIFSVTKDKNQ